MLHIKAETPMSPHASEHDKANTFSDFIKWKIQTIQDYVDNLQGNHDPQHIWQDQAKFSAQLSEFKTITRGWGTENFLNCLKKYCEQVRIPTNLLREYIDEILPLSLNLGDMLISPT